MIYKFLKPFATKAHILTRFYLKIEKNNKIHFQFINFLSFAFVFFATHPKPCKKHGTAWHRPVFDFLIFIMTFRTFIIFDFPEICPVGESEASADSPLDIAIFLEKVKVFDTKVFPIIFVRMS